MTLNDSTIDYMHWNDLNELVDRRLRLLDASHQARNNAHDNKMLSIIEQLREASHHKLNCVCMKWVSRVIEKKIFFVSCHAFPYHVPNHEKEIRSKKKKKLAPRDVGSSRNCTLRQEEIFREGAS